jgi:hypothetical protein
MKALVLALALLLAPPPKPISPPPAPPAPAAQPDAATIKSAPAKPAKPVTALSAANPLAECRATCSRSYYFCLQSEDGDTCTPSWNQCRAACLRANPQ